MLAVASGDSNIDTVKILLKQNSDIHILDANGNNLIHIASKYDNSKMLQYLVQNTKVNVFERNNKGETALSIATEKKNQQIIEILTKC